MNKNYLVSVLLLLVLVITGCGGSDTATVEEESNATTDVASVDEDAASQDVAEVEPDEPSEDPTEDPTEDPAAEPETAVENLDVQVVEVEIIDQGAEPREPLRYTFEEGTFPIVTHMRGDITQTMMGTTNTTPQNMDMAADVTITPNEHGAMIHSDYHTMTYNDMDISDASSDLTFDQAITDRGELIGGPSVQVTNGQEQASAVPNADWVLFPAEPVGVGARWSYTHTQELNGIPTTNRSEFTLVSRTDTHIEVTVTGEQIVAAGPTTMAGMDAGGSVTIREQAEPGTFSGTYTVDLRSALQLGQFNLDTSLPMSIEANGQTMDIDMVMAYDVVIEADQQ